MKAWPAKDPDELLDYTYDWLPDLETGETLASHVFLPVNAAGVTVTAEDLQDTQYVVWLSGGTTGETASWTHRVTTSAGRILEDTVVLPIVAKVAGVAYPGGYVMPTAGNLVDAFPEFATVPPSQLEYYLGRAATSVDESWSEADYGHAIMLLAAHYLTRKGLGTSAEAKAISSGADQFKSMGIASLSLVRFDKGRIDRAMFTSTAYGIEYAALLRRNKGGPRVTGTLSTTWGDGDHFGPWTQ